ncbi:hypothetical protein [Roseisolibacter agri]|uniref:Uncharacterized protein n=1 Tax=Roseisolibacter agri TaxID=2014610 RepID=A0AA37QEA4_9BACT|nr:hypothetical protein [Roseisolibacter agri]GLC24705.1 hypothetical protein rosag_12180 [Roseisolibacter agri]
MTDAPSDPPSHSQLSDPPEIAALVAELVRRLRPVTDGMPESEFLDLVRAIARRRHRWEQQARVRGP